MKTERSVLDVAPTGLGLGIRALARRAFQLVMLALLSTFASNSLAKDQDPVFSSHVTDLAAVMGAQAGAVDRKLKAFEAATGHQVFVLTVQTTGSRSIDEYAVQVFQKWKIGRAKIDDGVLLVIAVADRKMRIEVGYGLEGTLTDARASRIIHDVVAPQFSRGKYDIGIEAGVDAVLRTLVMPDSLAVPDPPQTAHKSHLSDYFGAAIFIVTLWIPAMLTLWFGLYGLLFVSFPALLLPTVILPGWPGKLLFATIIAAWLYGRWALIVVEVQKEHLKLSKNRFFTLLWLFFLYKSPDIKVKKGRARRFRSSYSFGSSDSSASSSSDDSSCGGSGGRSGGAGASGGW